MTSTHGDSLRGLVGLFRLEARRNIGLLAFVPFAGLTFWLALGQLPERIWLWHETSSALQRSVILLGPIVAGIAAWAAGRDHRRGIRDLLATVPTSRSRQSVALCFGTLAWCGAAYLIPVAILGGLTAWYATWGTPVSGPILIGLLVTLMCGAVGFASGYWIPSRFTAPAVAIVLFIAQVIVSDWASYEVRQFSPYRLGFQFQDDVFYDVQPSMTLPYAAWALGVTGVALSAVILKTQRTIAVWMAIVAACVATTAGASALISEASRQPERTAIAYEPVCDRARFPVCVHPAYEPLLPEASEFIRSIVEPVATLPGVPQRAEQRSMQYPANSELEGDRAELRFELVNVAFHQHGYHVLARDLSWRLVGAPENPMEAAAQAVVADWLIYQTGISLRDETDSGNFIVWGWTSPADQSEDRQALQRFIEMPSHERRDWLEENWVDLRAGQLTLADLP